MSTFWEPPPFLAIGAVVGSVILAYAVGFATAPVPTSDEAVGNAENSAGGLQDGGDPASSGEPPISHLEDQSGEVKTDSSPTDIDPQSATKS